MLHILSEITLVWQYLKILDNMSSHTEYQVSYNLSFRPLYSEKSYTTWHKITLDHKINKFCSLVSDDDM